MNGRLLLVLLFALPAVAQLAPNEVAVSFGRSDLEVLGDAPAIGVSYNRFWGQLGSVRFGAFTAGEGYEDAPGEERVHTLHASAEVHFLRGRVVSPYAGVGVAMASTRIDSGGSSLSETSFAPIVSGGLDFNVWPRWAIGVDGRWMHLRVDSGDRFGPYILDPLTVMGSVKYRF